MTESTAEQEPSGPGTSTGTASGPVTVGRPTLALGAAAIVALGFLGGYVVKDATADEGPFGHQLAGGQVMMAPGPNGPGGPDGQMAGMRGRQDGPPNVTVGTVKSVDGTTVTLTTAEGETAKVSIGSDAKVMVTKAGTAGDLSKGDEIVVHGQRDGDTIEADMVSKGGPFIRKLTDR
jgi:hypothetical protein